MGAGLASPHVDSLANDDLPADERRARTGSVAHVSSGVLSGSDSGADSSTSPPVANPQIGAPPTSIRQQHHYHAPSHYSHKRAFRDEDEPRSKRLAAESHEPRPAPELHSPSNPAPAVPSYLNSNRRESDVGFTTRSVFNPYHPHGAQSPPHQPATYIPGIKGYAPVPDLTQAWQRAQGSNSPTPAPLPGIKRKGQNGVYGQGYGVNGAVCPVEEEAVDEAYDAEHARGPPSKRHGVCSSQWFKLLPVRLGWPRLILYVLLGALFAFLLVHYALATYNAYQTALATARQAIEHEQTHMHHETLLASQVPSDVAGGGLAAPQLQLDVQSNLNADLSTPADPHPAVAGGPAAPPVPGEEPAPAYNPADLPPVTRESLVAELGKAFKDEIKPAAAAGAAAAAAAGAQASTPVLPPAATTPVIPAAADAVAPAAGAVTSPALAGGALATEAAPAAGGAAAAAAEAAAAAAAKAVSDAAAAQKAKEKANEAKKKDSAGKGKKKDKKADKDAGGKSKKIRVPKLTEKELKDYRAAVLAVAAPLTAAEKAVPWVAPAVASPFLLGSDVVVVVVTKSNRHSTVARSVARWGQHVPNLMIFSNAPDSEHGLPVQVLGTPHPEWKAIDPRYHSWRVGPMLRALRADAQAHAGQERFYLLLDDVTFPLLDQIAAKLNAYRATHAGQFPMLAGGPLQLVNFYKSYWKEQQAKAYNMFKDHQLQTSPAWLTGFSARYLTYLGEWIAHPDQCPTLFGDDLALAGLLACAGGMPGGGPATDERFLFGFFDLEKQAPAALATAEGADLQAWRKADAYHGVDNPDIIDNAYDKYYGAGLGVKKA